MANLAVTREDTIFENEAYLPLWRFTDATGTIYGNDDITSCKYDAIQLEPYNSTLLADDTTLTLANGDSTPTTSQVGWFDTLQTDQGWTEDSTGWNCVANFPGTLFATPGKVRIEVYVVLAADSSQVRCATFDVTVLRAHGS